MLESDARNSTHKKYGGLPYEFLKENLHQMLSDIDMAANRVAKIVNDLKNFSKQTDLTEKKPIDINLAVENALRLAQSTLNNSNITVELCLAPNLPQIFANIHSIEQVILNIVINAVQSMGTNKGKIDIQTG